MRLTVENIVKQRISYNNLDVSGIRGILVESN